MTPTVGKFDDLDDLDEFDDQPVSGFPSWTVSAFLMSSCTFWNPQCACMIFDQKRLYRLETFSDKLNFYLVSLKNSGLDIQFARKTLPN